MRAFFALAWCVFGILIAFATQVFAEGANNPPTRPTTLDPFKMVSAMTLEDGSVLSSDIYFYGQFGVVFDERGSCEMLFDLWNSTWYDLKKKNKATLRECEQWASMLKEKTLSELDRVQDPVLKEEIESSLRAEFTVSEDGDRISFKNPTISLSILPQRVDSSRFEQIHLFRVLNAYHKAFDGKSSPFPDLRVGDVLKARGLIPAEMIMKARSHGNTFTGVTRTRVEALTNLERAIVIRTINEFTTPKSGVPGSRQQQE